ncbi:preprotein translocase subunit SecE [Pseudonocardia sp. C8]|uniref:preprotein translocase subunit SecE n=1 Tax=Pseudonocardia sp. C8 TaxID=2762759 RepID=UPI00164257ED|nr:preprotein translocase subunit SecE [Pseudonocardia sp. C8]
MSDEHEPERPGRERPSNAADRRGRRASRSGSTPAKGRATPTRAAATTQEKVSLFGRLARYLREVVAELRKVIWPNRSQMVKYTIAVLVFVSFMVALVFLLDSAFAEGVALLFGN